MVIKVTFLFGSFEIGGLVGKISKIGSGKRGFSCRELSYLLESYPIKIYIFEILFQILILPSYPPISKDSNKKVTFIIIETNF